MIKAVYLSPRGDGEENPDDRFMESVFAKGDEYWQDKLGCGHGTIDFYENDIAKANLQIVCKEDYGCWLELIDKRSIPRRHYVGVAKPIRHPTESVVIDYAGEHIRVPKDFFLKISTALAGVKEFCRKGNLPAGIWWCMLKELRWDQETGTWMPPDSTR